MPASGAPGEHSVDDVREAAAESLLQLYRGNALPLLKPLSGDPVIHEALAESGLVEMLPRR